MKPARMTKLEVLTQMVRQAVANGFDFAAWCLTWLGREWAGEAEAIAWLAQNKQYYALVFSHLFAEAFWKAGTRMTFLVPATSYRIRSPRTGLMVEVQRKPFARRRTRDDAWQFHLGKMATADEPLRYMRRYLVAIPEDMAAKPKRPQRELTIKYPMQLPRSG